MPIDNITYCQGCGKTGRDDPQGIPDRAQRQTWAGSDRYPERYYGKRDRISSPEAEFRREDGDHHRGGTFHVLLR